MNTTPEQAAFIRAVEVVSANIIAAAKELQQHKAGIAPELYKKKVDFLNDIALLVKTADAAAKSYDKQITYLQREIKKIQKSEPEHHTLQKNPLNHLRFDREAYRNTHNHIQQEKYGY